MNTITARRQCLQLLFSSLVAVWDAVAPVGGRVLEQVLERALQRIVERLAAYGLCALIVLLLVWNVSPGFLPWVVSLASSTTEPTAPTHTHTHTTNNTAAPIMSGLSAAVTAGGMFLSTMVAALVSASASATAAAPAASLAFARPGSDGLGEAKILKKDWNAAAVTASELSRAVIDQVYDELDYEQKELGYVIHIIRDVANKIRDGGIDDTGGWFNKPWAVIRGPIYKEKRQVVRAVGYLSDLIERTRSTRTRFQKDANNLKLQLEVIMQLDDKVDGEVDGDAGDLGNFFQKGISKLNRKFGSDSAGGEMGHDQEQDNGMVAAKDDGGKARLDKDEAAAFIKDLHTAQGAGSMFRGAFFNAGERLTRLSDTLKDQKSSIDKKEPRMCLIRGWLGKAKTVIELQGVVDEVLLLSEELRTEIRSGFYAPDE
jgi:hypothetical protein